MRITTTLAALVAAAGSALAQSSLLINTPTALFQCQPYLVTWGGGQAPYFVRPTSDTQYTWTVNIPAGTSITLTITDSTGATAATAPVTINQGASGCLNAQGSSGLASSGSATNGQSTPSSTSLVQSSTGSASSAASSAASSVSTSASSAASSVQSSASSMSSASMASSSASMPSNTASGSAPSQSSKPSSGAVENRVGAVVAVVVGAVVALAA
uniref:Cell wall protein n=1 Tax=Rhodotorula toruloides TaxID=5286 RepID=A0A0K3CQP1_RHOTO